MKAFRAIGRKSTMPNFNFNKLEKFLEILVTSVEIENITNPLKCFENRFEALIFQAFQSEIKKYFVFAFPLI